MYVLDEADGPFAAGYQALRESWASHNKRVKRIREDADRLPFSFGATLKGGTVMGVSTAISARIQSLIDELQPGDALGQWPTRVCKDELNALPLRGNRIYLWALRPDGTVLRMDHEAFNHPSELETDPLVLHAVLTHGAHTHPDLLDLVPARPEGARPCSSCEGAGMIACGQDVYDSCLGCNGLGWIVMGQTG